MIKFEKLSYSFPQRDLYNNVSFTLEEGQHCAFIGTNGSGKSTERSQCNQRLYDEIEYEIAIKKYSDGSCKLPFEYYKFNITV